MTNLSASVIRAIVERYPAIVPHLKGRARWVAFAFSGKPVYLGNGWSVDLRNLHQAAIDNKWFDVKTYDYYLHALEGLIRGAYNNQLGGEFIDIMANLISGQLTQAFEQAWKEEEGQGELPDYLTSPLEDMILGQYDHVDGLYRDIVDARVDETPLEPLLSRAALWANQWTSAYNQAVALITEANGGNLIWEYGDTEHCDTCRQLDGIVAPASVWSELGVHPQQPENDLLDCGGWKCQCSLSPTDKRRSPKAYDAILNAVSK